MKIILYLSFDFSSFLFSVNRINEPIFLYNFEKSEVEINLFCFTNFEKIILAIEQREFNISFELSFVNISKIISMNFSDSIESVSISFSSFSIDETKF